MTAFCSACQAFFDDDDVQCPLCGVEPLDPIFRLSDWLVLHHCSAYDVVYDKFLHVQRIYPRGVSDRKPDDQPLTLKQLYQIAYRLHRSNAYKLYPDGRHDPRFQDVKENHDLLLTYGARFRQAQIKAIVSWQNKHRSTNEPTIFGRFQGRMFVKLANRWNCPVDDVAMLYFEIGIAAWKYRPMPINGVFPNHG
jgi:hypothetical protein